MRDNVKPGEKWEFNEDVAACFANMLERSIPDYKSMRALTYKAGERFIQPDTLIVDVGCSTGLAVEPFVEKYQDENDFLLIDNAPAMVDACRKRDIYEGLTPGGALILVEKIVSESLNELMVHLYYEMKRENGYTDDQIMEKRRSLENVLSPLKVGWNVDMLRTAGFKQVDMFWRCLNFCGWIAVK